MFRYLTEGLGEARRLRERMHAFALAGAAWAREAGPAGPPRADRRWVAEACGWIAEMHGWLSDFHADLAAAASRLLTAAGAAPPASFSGTAGPVAGPFPDPDVASVFLLWLTGAAGLEEAEAELVALRAELDGRELSGPVEVLACRDLLIRLAVALGELSRLHRHLEHLARCVSGRAGEGGSEQPEPELPDAR